MSIPFAPPVQSGGSSAQAPSNSAASAAVSAAASGMRHATVAGADVRLNPDGSITVANLKDALGQPHTVYLPYQRQIVPGHDMRVYIDGLPLNPISQDHLWLAQRARAIGVDTQLKSELKGIARHDLDTLEALADALVAGREEEARRLFRRWRHNATETNNFYKLARPLRTLLMMRRTPAGCLIDNAQAQVQLTYTVNSQGAVLTIFLGKRNLHIWDR